SKYDLLTVGECSGVTIEEAKKYASSDNSELNMVFQFEHMDLDGDEHGKWTLKPLSLPDLKENLSKWQTGLEKAAWNSLYWNNHDQPRIVSRWGNDSEKYRALSAKMLATCLHLMQGTPYIYQGEELGMTNYTFTDVEELNDIESKNAYQTLVRDTKVYDKETMLAIISRKSRDNARTVMQWDSSKNAGFSSGKPWFRVNPNYLTINAKSQVNDPDSVFNYYKKLISLRKEKEIIVYGSYELLCPEDENIFAFTRTLNNDHLLIICNFTDKELTMPYELEEMVRKASSVLISNYKDASKLLRPYEALVYCY
nr:alpha-glucosidase C-terminal domain-containing protein [Lachnospiraceae bacterium]